MEKQPFKRTANMLKFVDNGGRNGIISVENGTSVLKVNTGGKRNENPLTSEELDRAVNYAVSLGMPKEKIYYVDYDCTAYGTSFDMLRIGTDVYPSKIKQVNPNCNVTMKGAIAHEIVGHRGAALKGFTQKDDLLEEVQASLRAAKLTPELSISDRMLLARDGLYRLHQSNMRLRDVKRYYDWRRRICVKLYMLKKLKTKLFLIVQNMRVTL